MIVSTGQLIGLETGQLNVKVLALELTAHPTITLREAIWWSLDFALT